MFDRLPNSCSIPVRISYHMITHPTDVSDGSSRFRSYRWMSPTYLRRLLCIKRYYLEAPQHVHLTTSGLTSKPEVRGSESVQKPNAVQAEGNAKTNTCVTPCLGLPELLVSAFLPICLGRKRYTCVTQTQDRHHGERKKIPSRKQRAWIS